MQQGKAITSVRKITSRLLTKWEGSGKEKALPVFKPIENFEKEEEIKNEQ